MSQQASRRLPYDLHTITQNVPPQSGVYAIFSSSECLYIGASDDVCASLLGIYFEDEPHLSDKHLTHFSFDLVSSGDRGARQTDRIRELRPVCNLRMGVPGVRPSPKGTAEKAEGRMKGEVELSEDGPVLAFGGCLAKVGQVGPA
ncbi:MAG TPA: hypothetical protein VLM91_27345 [Candidatus Methylomirabilis sp.]|nr:hypothetical protein [Candidatus Methylomirabilis sp.]